MVDFGGWDMPVEYSGIISEHMAVRTSVGLFDVSHMGEIEIRGPRALELVEHLTPNAVSKLQDGQAQYSALLYPNGTFVDDILVHRMSADHYFLCVNASNQEKDYQWIVDQNKIGAEVEFASEKYVQLAIQGPRALATLAKLTDVDLAAVRYYWFTRGEVLGVPAIIARTGYTGEDGFEIYIPPQEGERLWNAIFDAGMEFGILFCGPDRRGCTIWFTKWWITPSMRLSPGTVMKSTSLFTSTIRSRLSITVAAFRRICTPRKENRQPRLS
jgi:aminomethyltransferase